MGSTKPLGVIVVGGLSSRMGIDKTSVEMGGRTMLSRVAAVLEQSGCDVLVAGRATPLEGHNTISDPPGSGAGPIAGLRAAAAAAAGRTVMLVGTDQPLLRPGTVIHLLEQDGPVVIPVDDGVPQVTCAVYRPRRLGPILDAAATLQEVARMAADTTWISPSEWREWGEDGRSWYSVDTPDQIAIAEAWPDEASPTPPGPTSPS